MTFISAVIATQGLILTADSKELVEGGHFFWEDFEGLLGEKGKSDESEDECISPKEITEIFQQGGKKIKGRVKSTDRGKKLFQINHHTALLTAGTANPGGKEFPEIVKEIQQKIDNSHDNSLNNVVKIISDNLNELKPCEQDSSSTYLVCGFDKSDATFKVYRLECYCKKMWLDKDGKPQKDSNGQPICDKELSNCRSESVINVAGMVGFHFQRFCSEVEKNPDLLQAFELSKRLMDLVVTVESISHSITGIGGRIYFAAITENGFSWVNTETDVQNLLLYQADASA